MTRANQRAAADAVARICAALSQGGTRAAVSGLRAALAHGVPAAVAYGDGRSLLVRWAALPSEGKAGTLVAELILGDARRIVANEAGPVGGEEDGTVRIMARIPAHLVLGIDNLGGTRSRHIRQAIAEYLERANA